MDWLAEHTSKFPICQFTQLAGLTVRNPRKNYLECAFSKSTASFYKENKAHYPTQKIGKNDLYLILGTLVGKDRTKIW